MTYREKIKQLTPGKKRKGALRSKGLRFLWSFHRTKLSESFSSLRSSRKPRALWPPGRLSSTMEGCMLAACSNKTPLLPEHNISEGLPATRSLERVPFNTISVRREHLTHNESGGTSPGEEGLLPFQVSELF